jgi:O-antigen/teichoic acid export membrane protein
MIIFAKDFGKLAGLKPMLIYLMIPFSFFNCISLTFEQIYGAIKKSKPIAISSLSRAYIGFGISLVIIVIFKTNKYYGPIIGQILGGALLTAYWIKCIIPYFTFSFDKSYLKYIFTYSVPLIPYVLSGVIIEQFGKIAIGNSKSVSDAGYYSLALAISSIVSIVISVSHQAWNPYYFEYMNAENYKQHDEDQNKIFRITIFLAIAIAAFGNEIGILLAKKSFTGSLYLVPIFVLGYVFYQLAYVYMRNFSYDKKTQYLTFTVLISGVSNVLLNVFLIPKLGQLGAAFSFVLSYVIMAIFAWGFNKFLVKHYGTPLKVLLTPLVFSLPFFAAIYFIGSMETIWLKIIIKLLLTSMLGIMLLWNSRAEIMRFLKFSKAVQ